jgi:hypothetical protein
MSTAISPENYIVNDTYDISEGLVNESALVPGRENLLK